MSRLILSLCMLITATACSNVPKNIQSAPEKDLQLGQVLQNSQSADGTQIRWGGEIIKVENTDDFSLVQVVQFPLNHYGKPVTSGKSMGRFIARTTDFVDPAVYKEGTLVTFAGIATDELLTRKIDQKQVDMPVINSTDNYRWQQHVQRRASSFYNDPFFYPYHSFYYNRWYGHPWYGPRFGYRYYYH